MELTQTIRDSTVVDHAKVAAQNKRKVFVVQLRDNAYDDPGSYARTGFAKIIEEIEEVGWRLEEMSPSQTKAGDIAHLLLFRPAADEPAQQPEAAQQAAGNTQPPAAQSYPQQHYGQTGGQYQQGYQQDPYAGQPQQYPTGGQQQYYQNPPQQQYPPQYPQQQQYPPQYPGYGQQGW